MSEKLMLLDQALEMSRAELGFLATGDVEEAERSAQERSELLERILGLGDEIDQDLLLSKLNKLRSMQGRLTAEAKSLHAVLKEDLGRVKKEEKRFSGYHEAATIRRPTNSRYLSKRG